MIVCVQYNPVEMPKNNNHSLFTDNSCVFIAVLHDIMPYIYIYTHIYNVNSLSGQTPT